MHQSPKIIIVGGGVASFVAGITLREKLPRAQITMYSAADEQLIGGQLASWDEKGYPAEHGLHALFGFYENIIPILKKVGAYENFTRSKKHTFVYERGKIHRFHMGTWLATYKGFTARERLKLAACLPVLSKIIAKVKREGFDIFDAYDRYDLREFGRMSGVPESIIQSNFCRQFYDAAFNEPQELSAAVALEGIYKIFSKPWHYYFNQPSRQSLIDPLRRYFIQNCGGTIRLKQKLVRVHTDEHAHRVTGLEFEELDSGKTYQVEADDYVFALGLEDFKSVDLGPAASALPYFQNIHRLETVSSVSFQAWFKEDPVPKKIDSLVCGLPEPLSILCPVTRVRAHRQPRHPGLPHEIIATGPEAGFEHIDDETLTRQFLRTLKKCGFKIPQNHKDYHVILRRNREPFHRYLLTRPGELFLRPTIQSPLDNLCLAGAWVRNSFALPCVDAAAEGAIKAAGIIAEREKSRQREASRAVFRGMPRVSPLVMPPPYRFPESTAAAFVLDVDARQLTEEISPRVELAPGLGNKALFVVARHEGVHSPNDPSGGRYGYNEILLAAFVREKRLNPLAGFGLYPMYLYVDDDAAMAAGREVYGFPKKMAQIQADERSLRVSRVGMAPGRASGAVAPIELIRAEWSHAGSASPKEAAMAFPSLFRGLMGQNFMSIPFFNTREMMEPVEGSAIGSSLRQLTSAPVADLCIRRTAMLRDLRLSFGSSLNDQLYRLTPSGTKELRASYGLWTEFGFSLGTARVSQG